MSASKVLVKLENEGLSEFVVRAYYRVYKMYSTGHHLQPSDHHTLSWYKTMEEAETRLKILNTSKNKCFGSLIETVYFLTDGKTFFHLGYQVVDPLRNPLLDYMPTTE